MRYADYMGHTITASSCATLVPISGSSCNTLDMWSEYYRTPYRSSDNDKQICIYCHGITYDDTYGHCKACGAPRGRDR